MEPLSGYPTIRIDPKAGKIYVEGATEEENKAINDRLASNPGRVDLKRHQDLFERTGNWEPMKGDGRVIYKPQMPVYCVQEGAYPEMGKMTTDVYKESLRFFQEDLPIEYIKDSFRDFFGKVKDNLVARGSTDGINPNHMRQMIEDCYESYRRNMLPAAASACSIKGRELYPEETYGRVAYYDSKFYHRSEAVLEALRECTNELAQEYGVTELKLKEHEGERDIVGLYENFNTIWSQRSYSEGVAIRANAVAPPEDFTFVHVSSNAVNQRNFVQVSHKGQTLFRSSFFNSAAELYLYKQRDIIIDCVGEGLQFYPSTGMEQANSFLKELFVFHRGSLSGKGELRDYISLYWPK